jgi:hypothetical protein
MGYMNGAGAQRSDNKSSLSGYTALDNGYYNSVAPQGDAVRLYNYVRLVRTALATDDTVGDGIPNAWRAKYFGSGGTTNATSAATSDPDGDGISNYNEYIADTNPTNASSCFKIQSVSHAANVKVFYQSSSSRKYTLYYSTSLSSAGWKKESAIANGNHRQRRNGCAHGCFAGRHSTLLSPRRAIALKRNADRLKPVVISSIAPAPAGRHL